MQLGSTELLIAGNRSRQREEMQNTMMKGRKEQTEKTGSTHLKEDKVEPRDCAQQTVHRGGDQAHRGDDQKPSLTCK